MGGTAVDLPTVRTISASELAGLNRRFEQATPQEIVAWGIERFRAEVCLLSSFADTVLVHLATSVDADLEVVFLDTGFHFAETLDTVRRAQARLSLNLTVVRPDELAADVWRDGTDACCRDRKVALLDAALAGRSAWMSGLRRADSAGRSDAPIVSIDRRGCVKINPLANWTDTDVAAYIADHDVLINPLAFQGYPSIGCWPCTEPVADGEDPRSGRWAGIKSECGLHL
ncbi:MAG: phosphoadenylyl-sulfate reductase [Acidimicrobiales bacterium]|nr:phosphoadenylyl-sulfate reductase [Acidimicrobiales bacterium]